MITPQSTSQHASQALTQSGSGNTRLNLPNLPIRSNRGNKGKKHQSTTKKRVSVNNSELHIHVDYLRLIGTGINQATFNDLLKSANGGKDYAHYSDKQYSLGKGCKTYENMAIDANKVKVLYSPQSDPLTGEISYNYTVDITGETLSQWDTVYIWRLSMQLSNPVYNGHFSRFDIAIDDYKDFNIMKHCMDAIEKGQNIGFKDWGEFTKGKGRNVTGKTLYLGNRESKRFTRIYDAQAKHGIDATRFETELKGKYAQQTVKEFINEGLSKRDCMDAIDPMNDEQLNQHLSTWLGKVAIGHIGFKNKDKQRVNGQVSDLPNLVWWDWFISRIGGVHKIIISKVTTTIEKSMEWMERQVSKPLARVKVALGAVRFREWLSGAVASGFERLDRFDELLIQDYKTVMS
jgi:hypothetical protein